MSRRVRVVLLLVALAVLAGSTAASARPTSAIGTDDLDQICATNPASCTVLPTADDPDVGTVANAVGGTSDTSAQTQKALAAIKAFTPENAVESWAQAAAQGSVSVLAKMQGWQDKVTKPAFDSTWWRQQYAVMFGLSLILFAFMLVVVVARIGGPQGSVSSVQLIRDSGLRLWFVPVIIALGPPVLAMLQGGAAELGRSFADVSGGSTGGATEAFLTKMTAVSGGFDSFGGAILALLILLGVMVFSVAVLIEVAVASWGLNLLGLVIPIALVMHIYPPWRRPLARLVGLMVGLMLAPVAVSFVYWAFWSSAASLTDGMDLFGISLFLLIGSFFLAIAPLLVMWLFPLVVPAVRLDGVPSPMSRPHDLVEPRSVNRLAGHFRTKEALSASAPMAYAPERTPETAVLRSRRGDVLVSEPWSTHPGDPSGHDHRTGERPAVGTQDPVEEQLGKKSSAEAFDPEPFDPPKEPT